MKVMKLAAVAVCSALLFVCQTTPAQTMSNDQQAQSSYEQWHKALAAHPELSEPLWFETNGPADLSSAVNSINSHKIAMAYFLCNKIAAEQQASYQDVWLLDHVAGINLWYSANPKADIGQEIAANTARFAKEWKEGLYNDPSATVAQLCESLSPGGNATIDPRKLAPIRRYGIFALPELTRQIKQHNSRPAFAAYLIISGQPKEYAGYIKSNTDPYPAVADKTNHLAKRFSELNVGAGKNSDIMQKWSAALAN